MNPKAKKALVAGGVIAAGLLLFAGAANAADDDQPDDDDDDDGTDDEDDLIIVEPPVVCPAGQFLVNGVCQTPPPPPNPAVCNYVGCGPSFQWVLKDVFPNERAFGLALQQLGYIINPAAATFSIVSPYNRSIVRQFQRDFNVGRFAPGVPQPAVPGLATDGLVGNNTIRAINYARQWVNTLGKTWMDIVASG